MGIGATFEAYIVASDGRCFSDIFQSSQPALNE